MAKWKFYKDRKVANAIEEEPLANEEPLESESEAPPRRYMDNRVVESAAETLESLLTSQRQTPSMEETKAQGAFSPVDDENQYIPREDSSNPEPEQSG